jgi:polyhydroxyalkanoate synthesis regulator phasin
MLDTVRKYVEAGRDALTPKKAEELARALIKQGQSRTDKVQDLARDLVDWSKRNSERFRDTVRHEVQKQMSRAGVASKTEVEALKRRIRQLESGAKSAAGAAKKATTRKRTASKSTAKKSTGSSTIGGGGATPTA